MNDLVVKKVPFCGTELLAVQEKDTEKIYAGINPILRDLGFDEKQIEYRRDKWVSDKSVGKGTQKFSGTYLGLRTGKEVWCIDIMKIPLALAKLEITPKMEKEMPELSEKLEEYQDRCADVLAAAFLHGHKAVEQEGQRIDAATLKGIANTGNLIRNTMKDEKAKPYETAMVLDSLFRQGGLVLPEQFIKIPEYEQMKLDDFMK